VTTIHLLHVAQPTTAGVALAVRQLASYQLSFGWEVTVACPADGTLSKELVDLGVPTVEWQATREPGRSTLREVRSLRDLIAQVDPTAVHLHSSKAGLAGRLALRGARPTVFQPNGWSFLAPGRSRRPARAWERLAARWTDLLVLVSSAERELAADVGIGGRSRVVRNGVDTTHFSFADATARVRARDDIGLDDSPLVVCVGRLCEQKGQTALVRQWGKVREQVPGARLVLVGSGPDRAEIEATAGPGVVLAGEQADVRPWLAAADVVAQPSRWEGQSFATVEAMAVGRLVVAFDVEGMEDALADVGVRVPPGDDDAFGAAIVRSLRDGHERSCRGTAARARAEALFDVAVPCGDVTRCTQEMLVQRVPHLRSEQQVTAHTNPSMTTRPSAPGVPTFLLIGAARSGTTFLTHHLGRHPDVHVSEPKEPHFLAYGGDEHEFRGPGDETVVTRAARFDEPSWRALFPGGCLAQGEGSVSTLYRWDRAVPRIAELCPDVRMIVVLREPVERTHSAWAYQVSRGFETLSFADALDAEPDRIAAGWQHLWHYVAMSRYSEQLQPFITAFGRSRLLVLDYGDLRRDPQHALSRCFAFLGVDPLELGGLDLDINAGGQPKSRLVLQAMKLARSVEPVRRAVRATVPVRVREQVRNANLRTDTVGLDVRGQLDERFVEERAALVALLGTDAPAWAAAP
jgi:glycosyltransferase involved in cell wall biosynthesis